MNISGEKNNKRTTKNWIGQGSNVIIRLETVLNIRRLPINLNEIAEHNFGWEKGTRLVCWQLKRWGTVLLLASGYLR